MAANAILDRGLGKPAQPVDVTLTKQLNTMTREELMELRDRYVGNQIPQLIEATATPVQDGNPKPAGSSAGRTDGFEEISQ